MIYLCVRKALRVNSNTFYLGTILVVIRFATVVHQPICKTPISKMPLYKVKRNPFSSLFV